MEWCCCCSVAKSCPTLCDPMDCSTPGFPVITISWSLLELTFIQSVMPSNHPILYQPLLLCLQSFPASGSFLMSWLFPTIHQSIGVSTSASVLLMNIQDWFPLLSRFSRIQLWATPYTAAHQAPLSLGFSRQEHWSGLPFPSPMHESEKWKWSRSVVSDS